LAPRQAKTAIFGASMKTRSIKQFIKTLLDRVQSLELAKVLVRRVLRYTAHLRTHVAAARGWCGFEWDSLAILDSRLFATIGLLPTLAANAWFHKKVTVSPPPTDLPSFMTTVENFALGPYAQAKAAYPEIDREILKTLSEIVGIPPEVLIGFVRLTG
jgi:hypothetical protein